MKRVLLFLPLFLSVNIHAQKCDQYKIALQKAQQETFDLFIATFLRMPYDAKITTAANRLVASIRQCSAVWCPIARERYSDLQCRMIGVMEHALAKNCGNMCSVTMDTLYTFGGNYSYCGSWCKGAINYNLSNFSLYALPVAIAGINYYVTNQSKRNEYIETLFQGVKQVYPDDISVFPVAKDLVTEWEYIIGVADCIEQEDIPEYVAAKREFLDALRGFVDVLVVSAEKYVSEDRGYDCSGEAQVIASVIDKYEKILELILIDVDYAAAVNCVESPVVLRDSVASDYVQYPDLVEESDAAVGVLLIQVASIMSRALLVQG